jgi:hypothetical protein
MAIEKICFKILKKGGRKLITVDLEYPKISDIKQKMADEALKVKIYAIIKEKQVKFKNNDPSDKYIDLNVMDGSGIINVKICINEYLNHYLLIISI